MQKSKEAKVYPKREPVIDLTRHMNKSIAVKFAGGREVVGMLKGFDTLMNLVLGDTKETVGGVERNLGTVVCRSTSFVVIYPVDGSEAIQNPFQSESA